MVSLLMLVLPLAAPALLHRLGPLRGPAELSHWPLLRTPLQGADTLALLMQGITHVTPQSVVMIGVSFVLFYLGIGKNYEPLLLLPIRWRLPRRWRGRPGRCRTCTPPLPGLTSVI